MFFRRMRITEFFSNEEHRTVPAANRDNQIHPSSSKYHKYSLGAPEEDYWSIDDGSKMIKMNVSYF